jgi:transaldolase
MQLLPSGIFHGVTTNPQLLERAKEPNTIENIHRLADIALNEFECNEFMCQAWGGSVEEIVQCALWLVQPFEREQIVVKVPITEMGLQAANILIRDHDIRVCLTACYHRKQALSAVGVGAEYVAPYLGRMTEVAGKNGTEECMEMQDIVSGLGSETRVLVASIREPDTLAELASYGMDTFTFSAEVARKLFFDSWTEQAAREFEASALKNTGEFPMLHTVK